MIQVQRNEELENLNLPVATYFQSSRGTLNPLYNLTCLLKTLLEMHRKIQTLLEIITIKASMGFVLIFPIAFLKNKNELQDYMSIVSL